MATVFRPGMLVVIASHWLHRKGVHLADLLAVAKVESVTATKVVLVAPPTRHPTNTDVAHGKWTHLGMCSPETFRPANGLQSGPARPSLVIVPLTENVRHQILKEERKRARYNQWSLGIWDPFGALEEHPVATKSKARKQPCHRRFVQLDLLNGVTE